MTESSTRQDPISALDRAGSYGRSNWRVPRISYELKFGWDRDAGADCAVQTTFFCFSCSASHSMQPGAHMVGVEPALSSGTTFVRFRCNIDDRAPAVRS